MHGFLSRYFRTTIFRAFPLFLLPALLISACDETPVDDDPTDPTPQITSLEVNPSLIQFDENSDPVTDTAITVQLQAAVNRYFPEDARPSFTVFRQGSPDNIIAEGTFDELISSTPVMVFGTQFQLELMTTDFESYVINVYYYTNQGDGNTSQSEFDVRGIPQFPPEILDVANPDTVVIPRDGEPKEVFSFRAEVVDPEGQETIDRVLVDIVQPNGNLAGGMPFQLYDDGTGGDAVAADSIYTRVFEVTSSNNPQDYTLRYYAFDKTGLGSDTVTSEYHVVQ